MNKTITLWYRETAGNYEFNHTDDGFSSRETKPYPKAYNFPLQNSWTKSEWIKEKAWLVEGVVQRSWWRRLWTWWLLK